MDTNQTKIENIVEQALQLHRAGKSLPEILSLFPNEQAELREIFEAVGLLKTAGKAPVPDRALLSKIIAALPAEQPRAAVTNDETESYIYNGGTLKGRSSKLETPVNPIKFIMSKLKIWLPIGVIVAVVILFAAGVFNTGSADALSLNAIEDEAAQAELINVQLDDDWDAEDAVTEINAELAFYDDNQSSATDAFDLTAINSESEQVDNQSIDNFFQEESDLKELNASLNI